MELSTIYFILILPSIGSAITAIGAIIGVGFGVSGIVYFLNGDMAYGDQEKKANFFKAGRKAIKTGASICFPIIFLASFIPSSKQMMYMIGGYAATNVENIEKLPKNVVNAANKFLESYTDKEKK
jgi:hypothetical protein